jgi:hypothetical protein
MVHGSGSRCADSAMLSRAAVLGRDAGAAEESEQEGGRDGATGTRPIGPSAPKPVPGPPRNSRAAPRPPVGMPRITQQLHGNYPPVTGQLLTAALGLLLG